MALLRRMAGRVEAGGANGADRAFRLALARAARDEMGLSLDVDGVRDHPMSLAELVESLVDRSLLAVLDAPRGDGLGLFAVEPGLLAGMIALLTTGRAGQGGGDTHRRPTRTDAAMLAPLADAALVGLAAELAGHDDASWADGWRYASFLEDARPLSLLLDETVYRTMTVAVSLAQGAVTGTIVLALPADARARRNVAPVLVDDLETAARADAFRDDLARQVGAVTVRLDAELARLELPLSRAMALTVGEVLPLGDATVGLLQLRGIDGQALAEGRLGQMRGSRAVRLALPVADDPRLTG